MGDAAVEQLVRHIPLLVQIADMGGAEPKQLRLGKLAQQRFHAPAPFLGSTAVKFVQNDQVRGKAGAFFFRQKHEPGVGQKLHIAGVGFSCLAQVFHLGLPDIFAGGQPADPVFGPVLTKLEANKGFAGTGGVNHRRLAGFSQQPAGGVISLPVMGE